MQIGALLGAGGFSSVYRTGDGFAIKIAHDNTPSTIARFQREAEALSMIGAPFVPSLVDTGSLEDGRPFLVMELLDGETLAQRLARAPLSIREACTIAVSILDSLAGVRAHEIAHRDLKPQNIILDRDGSARLIDFGLVSDCNATRGWDLLTRAGMILGTAEYMAPEQFRGEPAGLSVDVYAFGVILYELLTGKPPFVGDRAAVEHGHLHMRPACPSLVRPMPESLENLVLACLAKEPERRPNDLTQVRHELDNVQCDERPSARAIATRAAIKMESTRPVVLLYVDGAPPEELGELVESGRARVARQRSDETVLAFLGTDHDRPLEAALGVGAEAIRRWACRGVVHVGRVLVRHTGGRVALFGRDIERAAAWIPETPWSGVVLTSRAAEALGMRSAEPFVAAPAITAREEMQVIARDQELASIRTAIADALRNAKPRCCVIVGEPGVGKSALAHELSGESPDTLVMSCARPVGGDTEQTLRQLLRYLLGVESDAQPAEPLALIAAAMGDAIASTCSEAVLVALGWRTDASLAPSVYRNQVRRAALAGLQRRAAQSPVVIIVDDAQFADEMTLEILERACRIEGSALAVVMTCTPRFRTGQPFHVTELRPLDASSTSTLARRLLPHGTRVSAAVLQRLAQWCGGNPGVLTQLINVLVHEGIIRRHEGTSSWFVAADELDRMPASPAAEWLATRELDTLSAELADFARLCALLGSDVSLDELEAVQRGLETDGYDRPMLDAAAGLSMLVDHGLLGERVSGRFSFRRGATQEALYALVPEATRVAVHRYAFLHWQSHAGESDAVFRLAHHGGRGGFRFEARGYYATLAERARARHAYAEAERMLTAAIELCDDDDVRYEHLEARGNVRRLLTHYEAARCDFAQARELAERAGDPAKVVSVLVAEAAVCDFTQEWDAQARLMQAAQAMPHDALPARVEARYLNWLGVARARQGQCVEAIELLRDARALGSLIGDHETYVGSGLLLGYLLAADGQREAGFAILDDTMACCERVGDWFHLVMGLNNRIILSKLTETEGQAEADCQRAIELSHEHGYHQLEIWGMHNLSLTRWWQGNFAGALHAAQLAYELSLERFGSKSSHRERLHYAMHLVAHGRCTDVRAMLDGLREQEFEKCPIDCANLAALRLALSGGTERAWREVIERTREVGDDCDFVEVLWLRARAALQWGDRIGARKALGEAHEHALGCGAPVAKVLLSEYRALITRSFHDAPELPA